MIRPHKASSASGTSNIKKSHTKLVPDPVCRYKNRVCHQQSSLFSDPSRREPNIPIIHVKQGYEPPTFTGFFTEWDPQMWMKEQKFEELREEIDRQKPLLQVDLIVADTVPNFYECEKYPLNVLLERDPEKLPVGIDVQHKELYLSSEEFFDVFSMKYSEYSGIPKWKQDCLKKNVGLF